MNTRTTLALLALSSIVATACTKGDSKPTGGGPDSAAPIVSVAITPASAVSAVASGVPALVLKTYFPQDGAGGYHRVHRASKDGYAEATLEKDGKEIAILSITDAERMAYVKAKFENATEKLEGYPLLTDGKDLSTILVKERFQIKVLSKTLDADARKAILASFDLKGLAS
jgi:hypothetical protein